MGDVKGLFSTRYGKPEGKIVQPVDHNPGHPNQHQQPVLTQGELPEQFLLGITWADPTWTLHGQPSGTIHIMVNLVERPLVRATACTGTVSSQEINPLLLQIRI